MTTYTSATGIVFFQPGNIATAQHVGAVRLTIVAEELTAPVTFFGQQSTQISNIIRVGNGPSRPDATPHDTQITFSGNGLPEASSWTYGIGVLRWGASNTSYIVMAQDEISGRELMIQLSGNGATLPTIADNAQLQSFLSSVTGFSFLSANSTVGGLVGTFEENDYIRGSDSSEEFSIGVGNDTVIAGGGQDRVFGGSGRDSLVGDSGNDLLYGDDDGDQLNGSTGNDSTFGGAGNDTTFGGDGDDILNGGSGNDLLNGENGQDVIDGGDGFDWIFGGSGVDQLSGGMGNDIIYGGIGNDRLVADWGLDRLYAGDGDDRIFVDGFLSFAGQGSDVTDIVYAGNGNDSITDIAEGNITGGINIIYADSGNDTVVGSGGDSVYGGAGNDVITRYGGSSYVEGGLGNDVLQGYLDTDRLYGGAGHDNIKLSSGRNSIGDGGAGRDTLTGGVGANNKLYGGADADTFVISLTSFGIQNSSIVGGSGVDLVQLRTLDSVSDISRTSAGITIEASSGGKITFSGVERFWMPAYGFMSERQFFDFWDDLLT